MLLAVLDTNIILSSLLQPLGPPAKVLYLARRGFLQLCVSGPVYAEYEEVLQRPRFSRIAAAIQPTLQFIRESGLWVRPAASLRVCKDPDDDIFLECAQEAGASWLVTGNNSGLSRHLARHGDRNAPPLPRPPSRAGHRWRLNIEKHSLLGAKTGGPLPGECSKAERQ